MLPCVPLPLQDEPLTRAQPCQEPNFLLRNSLRKQQIVLQNNSSCHCPLQPSGALLGHRGQDATGWAQPTPLIPQLPSSPQRPARTEHAVPSPLPRGVTQSGSTQRLPGAACPADAVPQRHYHSKVADARCEVLLTPGFVMPQPEPLLFLFGTCSVCAAPGTGLRPLHAAAPRPLL